MLLSSLSRRSAALASRGTQTESYRIRRRRGNTRHVASTTRRNEPGIRNRTIATGEIVQCGRFRDLSSSPSILASVVVAGVLPV